MRIALTVTLASLVFASTASADATVQAVDGTGSVADPPRWTPAEVTVKAGETVTWRFAGTTGFHNIASTGVDWIPTAQQNWSFRNGDPVSAPPDASYVFDTPGTYFFVCEIHATTMKGKVIVTDESGTPPPPPPPPPPGQQPWGNDQAAPTVFEVLDERPPVLSRVRVRGTRVRFRLSEAGRAAVTVKRRGRTVRTRRVAARRGSNAVSLRGLRAGRYRVEVRAWDLANNPSPVKRARLTVRR